MGLCSRWTFPSLWYKDTWTTEKAYGFLIGRRQSRGAGSVEGKIFECSIWQKEKLWFLHCPPHKLYGVPKGSSACRQERVEEKRWSDIFGNISPAWCLQKGNPQRALVSLPRELQGGNVLLLHCQTPLVCKLHFENSECYFYHKKKKKSQKFCTALIQILCPSFGQNPDNQRPQLSGLDILVCFYEF